MIISPWLIYFASIADGLKNGCVPIAIFSIIGYIALFGLTIGFSIDEDKNTLDLLKSCKRMVGIISIISLFLAVFVPSTNDIYKIIVIPTIVNSSVTQKIPDELQQLIDKLIAPSPTSKEST